MRRNEQGLAHWIVLVVVMGIIGLAGYRVLSVAHATSTTHTVSANLKPVIAGLIDKDAAPPTAYYSVMPAYVVTVKWYQLQSSQNSPITANNPIDQAIAQVQTINQQNPGLNMSLKLRVLGGAYAPTWLKNLTGNVMLTNGASGTPQSVADYWTTEYGTAYQQLQNELAAKYDTVPEIREVAIARCMTFSAEPFVQDIVSTNNIQAYQKAGLTAAADQACETQQIDESTAWQQTNLDLSFNPFVALPASGTTTTSSNNVTEQVMQYCRSYLSQQCVLENNSLISPPKSTLYKQLYTYMQQQGAPLTFQTENNSYFSNTSALLNTLQAAVNYGANSVELHEGFEPLASPSQLAPYNSALQSNPT